VVGRRLERKPRGEYHHGNLRRALIDATVILLGEHSPESFTLREVARRIGVDHRAAYRHFADRETLFEAVAEDGFRDLIIALQHALAGAAPTARSRLLAFGKAYVRFAIHAPGHYRVMTRPRRDERRSRPPDAADDAFAMLEAEIAAGVARGELIAANRTDVAVTLWMAMHGLAHLLAARRLYVRRDELAAFIERVLAHSLDGVVVHR